ncbi:MAG: DEAD/DEAH box helicase [Rhodopirellula sp.]|nr:DEAD/DEAH box helicase [Rhodopirellula sp.]
MTEANHGAHDSGKPPVLPAGTTSILQVRDKPTWQWRICNLNKNGVWEPDKWLSGESEGKSPGLFLTTREQISGPPQSVWPKAWGKLVLAPRLVPIRSAEALLEELKSKVPSQDVHAVTLEPESPKYGKWPAWVKKLTSAGLCLEHERPYQHQADALEQLEAQKHVVIATGTASGKSLCFQLPILRALLADPMATALYVSPAKALCADQLEAWAKLLGVDIGKANYFDAELAGKPLRVLRYDRDVKEETGEHKAEARIVLTNSSMLHYMLAQAATEWNGLFSALRYVVIDEVHTARGVVGANIAWIIRRLRRAAWRLSAGKAKPQFAFCSATIGKPEQLARQLIGPNDSTPISSVRDDTSGRGKRVFVSWTPKGASDGIRRVTVVPDLVQVLLDRTDGPIQTICFHRSRPEANLVARQCAARLTESGRDDLAGTIDVFIAMLTPEKRRELQDALRQGDCPCVFATSALELGIDIGDLSAAIILGIPHSRTGFRQMSGRVGRRPEPGREAIVIYVPRDDPLHDWYAQEKHFRSRLVTAESEDVPTDPDNELVSRRHMAAAAKELPPIDKDGRFFGVERWRNARAELKAKGFIQASEEDKCFYWVSKDEDPHKRINVLATRGNCEVQIKRKADGQIIGQTDNWSALWMLFPGAIYFDGIRDTYVVESLHLGALESTGTPQHLKQHPAVAWVRKAKGAEAQCSTIAEQEGAIRVLDGGDRPAKMIGNLPVYSGSIQVSTKLLDHYVQVPLGKPGQPSAKLPKKRLEIPQAPTAVDADGNSVEYPELAFETDGLWFRLPEDIEAELTSHAETSGLEPEAYILSCIHGAEHLILKMTGTLPGFCEDDMSGLSFSWHDTPGGPAIFIYEYGPGGNGLARRLLQGHNLHDVFRRALDVVRNCPNQCENGCPLCVLDRQCSNANSLIDKKGAERVLEVLVQEKKPHKRRCK